MKFITETILYKDGFYFRIGNRIYLKLDKPAPAGIEIIAKSKRFERDAWTNIFGEKTDGVSYQVKGWAG